jgi:Flp pilus assembly pilin Flp
MKALNRKPRGQGLVEYALLLVLVALVVVVAASLLGMGLQRVYGIAAAALGAKQDVDGPDGKIVIEDSTCFLMRYSDGTRLTGLYIFGYTDLPLTDLNGSTNLFMDTPYEGLKFEFSEGEIGGVPVPGSFAFNPLISATEDNPLLCPAAVTIQSKTKPIIAVAPMTKCADFVDLSLPPEEPDCK